MRFVLSMIIGVLASSLLYAEGLKIYTEEMPPYNFHNNDTHEADGFAVEIVRQLLSQTKNSTIAGTIQVFPWARAYDIVQKEKNVMLFSMTRSAARENLFKWVGPIAPRIIWFWKLKDRTDIAVNTVEDAKKYLVGGVHEFASTKHLQSLGFEVELVTQIKQNWLKLFGNRIELVTALELEAAYHMRTLGKRFNQLERLVKVDDRYNYYLALSSTTDDKIVQELQETLDTLKKEGIYDEIWQRYLQ